MCRCSRCLAGLRVLNLEEGADEQTIREAWLDLAKVWHPDRFESDQRLRARAEERFKRIQVAVRELQEHYQRPAAAVVVAYANGQEDAEPSRGRDLFRILVDGDRYFLHPQLPDYAVERVRRCDGAAAASLLGFVDLSLSRTGRSFLAFTQDSLLIRDIFSTRWTAYTDLCLWNVVLTACAADRFFDKASDSGGEPGCTLELRHAGTQMMEPLKFGRRSQAEVFAAVIRQVQQSRTF
jgi:hypothetical protein